MATAQQIEPGKYNIYDESGEPVVEGAPEWAVSPKLKQTPAPEPTPAPQPAVDAQSGPRPEPARVTPDMLPPTSVESESGVKYPSTTTKSDPGGLNLNPPTPKEQAALRPNPYDTVIKFVRNPSGTIDLVSADGEPIKFNVPENLVPAEVKALGADRAEPLVQPDVVEAPSEIETYEPGIQEDYSQLLKNMAENGTITPEELNELQAGQEAPAASDVAPLGGQEGIRPEPASTTTIAPSPGGVPAAPPPAQAPTEPSAGGNPLALFNAAGEAPPPLAQSPTAMAQASSGPVQSVPDVQPNMSPNPTVQAYGPPAAPKAETPEDRAKEFYGGLPPPVEQFPKPELPKLQSELIPATGSAPVQSESAPTQQGRPIGAPLAVPGTERDVTGTVDPEGAIATNRNVVVGGGGTRPARWELGAAGRTQQLLLPSPELEQIKAEEEDALWAKKANIMNAAYEEKAQLDAAAVKSAEASQAAKAELARIEDEDRQRREAVATRIKNLEIKQAQLADSRTKFNPDRKWENRSIFSKIFARIALGLGAMGAAMTGSKNFALEEFQNDINNDIEAQKAEIAAKKGDVDLAANLVAQEQTNWRTPAARDAAVRMQMLQVIENDTREQAARRGSAAAMAKAMGLIDLINQDKLEQRKIIEQAEAGYETRQSVYQKAQTYGPRVVSMRQLTLDRMKQTSKLYPDDPAAARAEAIRWASSDFNQASAPSIFARELKYASKEASTGKLPVDQVKQVAAERTQSQLIDLAAAFDYGKTGTVEVTDAFGHTQQLSGKAAAEHIAKGALVYGRAKANNDMYMLRKMNASMGVQTQLLEQINSWRDAMKAWRSAVERGDPSDIVAKYKQAASSTLETRSQAFLSRLVPGTNLGTKQSENLISGPLSLFEASIDADYKTITARIIHNMVGAKRAAGIKTSADKLLDEEWDNIMVGSYTKTSKEEVKAILKSHGTVNAGYVEPHEFQEIEDLDKAYKEQMLTDK